MYAPIQTMSFMDMDYGVEMIIFLSQLHSWGSSGSSKN